MRNTFWPVVGCLLLSGCLEPTQITFDITTDVPCERVSGTSIVVGVAGTTENGAPVVVTRDCRADGTVGAIGTYTLVPNSDPKVVASARVTLAVGPNVDVETDCTPENSYKGCIVSRRRLSFVPHQNLVVPVQLYLVCTGVACEENSTCNRAGRCVSSTVDTSTCVKGLCSDLGADAGVEPDDAGPGDAGSADGGADAGIDQTVRQLRFSVQPQSQVTAGAPFNPQPVVQLLNAAGQLTGSTSAVTLKAYSDATCQTEVALGLSGTLSVASVAGQATFTGVAASSTSVLRIGASALGLSLCSDAIAVQPGAAAVLAFATQPSTSASTDSPLAQQPVVEVRDLQGNRVSSAQAMVTLEAHSTADCSAPVVNALTAMANPVASVSGSAAFSAVTLTRTQVVAIKALAPGLMAACSTAVQVTSGAATSLVFATQPPSSGTAGLPLSRMPVVRALDALGNVVTGYRAPITVTAHANAQCTSPLSGAIGGLSTVAAMSGESSFGISVDNASAVALQASAGPLTVCSTAFNIAAGAIDVAASTVLASPSSVQADGTSQVAVTVTLVDSFSNPVAGTMVSLASSRGVSDAISSSPVVSSSLGVASFTVASRVAGPTVLTATAGSALRQTPTVTFTPGAATRVSFVSHTALTGTADAPLASTLTAQILDANNNVVTSSNASVQLRAYAGATCGGAEISGAVSATTNPLAATQGLAQFAAVTVTQTSVGSIGVSSGSLTSDCVAVTVAPGAPTALVFTRQPSATGTAGVALAQTPQVELRDAHQNVVTSPSATVTLTGHSNATCTALVSGGVVSTPVTTSQGVATFGATTVNKTAVLRLQASDGTRTVCSQALAISPAAIDTGASTFVASPSVVFANGTSTATLTVTLVDALGNPIPGKSVAIVGPSAATLVITSTPSVTNTQGVATFTVRARELAPMVFTASVPADAAQLVQTATVTFVQPPRFSIERPGYVLREGFQSTLAGSSTFNVVRDIGGTAASVTVEWLGVTANSRFIADSAVINFAAGETSKPVTFFPQPLLNDDGVRNGDLFFAVRLSAPTNGHLLGLQSNAKVWLVDDELGEGDFMFDSTLYTASAGSPAQLRVMRAGGRTTGTASVDVSFGDASAVATTHYTATTQTVNFATGETEKLVSVPTVSTTGNRSFFASLSNPSNGWALRTVTRAKVRILGTDASSTACDPTNTTLTVNNGFGGGQGTPVNPYQICSITQLGRLKTLLASQGNTTSYILMADLDVHPSLDSDAEQPGLQPFTGLSNVPLLFDGNERVVWNYRTTVTGSYGGFFYWGCINGVATQLRGLNLEHEVLTASGVVASVGLLEGSTNPWGYTNPAIRENNSTSGFINAPGGSSLGGLIGSAFQNSGTVSNRFNFSNVRIVGASNLGGLVGHNYYQDNVTVIPLRDGAIAVLEPSAGYAGGYAGRSEFSFESVTDSEFSSVILAAAAATALGGYDGYADVHSSFSQTTNPTNTKVLTRIFGGVDLIGGMYGGVSCVRDMSGGGCNAGITGAKVEAHLTGASGVGRMGGLIGYATSRGQYQLVNSTVTAELAEATNVSSTAALVKGWGGLVGRYDGIDYGGSFDNGLFSITSSQVNARLTPDQNPGLSGVGGLVGVLVTSDYLTTAIDDTAVKVTVPSGSLTGDLGGLVGYLGIKGRESVTRVRSIGSAGATRVVGNISAFTVSSGSVGGAFGRIEAENGFTTPTTFTVDGVYQQANVNGGSGTGVGGLIGTLNATSAFHSFSLQNIAVSANVAGGSQVGGMIGAASFSATDNTLAASKTFTTGTHSSNTGQIGGWAGRLSTVPGSSIQVQRSYSAGSVTGFGMMATDVCGFAGRSLGAEISFTDVYTVTNVSQLASNSAGFTRSDGTAGHSPVLTRVHAYQSMLPFSALGLTSGSLGPNTASWFCSASGGQTDALNIAQSAAWFTSQANFTGWDFVNTWAFSIPQYPTLRGLPASIVFPN